MTNSKKAPPKIILVVDDDKAILKVITQYLDQAGYAVLTAETAEAFIETAGRAQLHAVLLDMGLPDMDGLEALQKVRAIHPELCVIVVTGSHEQDKGRQAIELGAWDFVTKPVDFKYLMNALSGLS